MIEVEIRGELSQEQWTRLRDLFQRDGTHVESHHREMLMLRGYPGYSKDPVAREVDIRLRDTNGHCEIMVKHKASENNVARTEVSLGLEDNQLENARFVLRALGFTKANQMIRDKEIYNYHDVEWSLVRAPKNIFYFEAEKSCADLDQINDARQELQREAKDLDLHVFNDDEMKTFIAYLDRTVNIEVDL